jgi:hypothetical protein
MLTAHTQFLILLSWLSSVARIMIEMTNAVVRTEDDKMRAFYLRVETGKGEATVIVAIAGKILTAMRPLLLNGRGT